MGRRESFSVGELTVVGIPQKVGGTTVTVLQRDLAGRVLRCMGATIPANDGAGYAIGAEFIKSDAATGQCVRWINHGTATACAFRPHGPVIGYGFAYAAGKIDCSDGVTAFTHLAPVVRATDISLVQYQVSDDTDQILAQIATDGVIGATLSADPSTTHAVNVAVLRAAYLPMYDIFAAGKKTTAGGGTTEDITVTGVNASDLVFAQYSESNDTDVIAKAAYQAANTIRVTVSADPLTVHELSYVVLRPRGSFIPSHYIFAAGVHTTTANASAYNDITIAGALATDVGIAYYNTTNDTDTIVKAVMSADKMRVTMSADPSTAHKLAYMVLRAY